MNLLFGSNCLPSAASLDGMFGQCLPQIKAVEQGEVCHYGRWHLRRRPWGVETICMVFTIQNW